MLADYPRHAQHAEWNVGLTTLVGSCNLWGMKALPNISPSLTPMQEAFVENIAVCKTWKEAALQAGYSLGTAENVKAMVKKSPALLTRLQAEFEADSKIMLPDITSINKKVITLCLKDIENAPKFQKMLENIQKTAGVLQEQPVIANTFIKVENIQAMVKVMHEGKTQSL